jgi:hypothetical protein
VVGGVFKPFWGCAATTSWCGGSGGGVHRSLHCVVLGGGGLHEVMHKVVHCQSAFAQFW